MWVCACGDAIKAKNFARHRRACLVVELGGGSCWGRQTEEVDKPVWRVASESYCGISVEALATGGQPEAGHTRVRWAKNGME